MSDLKQYEEYYENNFLELQKITEPFHIDRTKLQPPLSNSLLYIPNGPNKGLHVLCKTHGGVKEIGFGSFNRVTLALHLDTGKKMAFRSALSEDISASEINANKITAPFSEFFASGTPVHYKGPWNPRESSEDVNYTKNKSREHNKTGFIMEYLEGGDLYQWGKSLLEPIPYSEAIRILRDIARCVQKLHELELVHLDLKMNNVFMTKDRKPKIGDFGFTVESEAYIKKGIGTLGMIPPEMIPTRDRYNLDLKANHIIDYNADPLIDVWSMGCLFAEFMGTDWLRKNGQLTYDAGLILDNWRLEMVKEDCFPENEDEESIDFVIYCCLQYLKHRPSAKSIANHLDEMYQKY